MMKARLTEPGTVIQFVQGGNATFTLRSLATGTRFTYRMRESDDGKVFFVSLMNGPDNEGDFVYIGYIRDGAWRHGAAKAKAGADAPAVRAFAWVWQRIAAGVMPDQLEFWHEGRCCRCARKLTVPESIAAGIGPECAGRIEAEATLAELGLD